MWQSGKARVLCAVQAKAFSEQQHSLAGKRNLRCAPNGASNITLVSDFPVQNFTRGVVHY